MLVFCYCQTSDDTHYKFIYEKILFAPSKEKMSREVFSGGEISGVLIKNFYLTTRGYCSISYARVELMFDFIGSALFFKIHISRNRLFKSSEDQALYGTIYVLLQRQFVSCFLLKIVLVFILTSFLRLEKFSLILLDDRDFRGLFQTTEKLNGHCLVKSKNTSVTERK